MLGFAALFKIMHWPGAGIMLTLGAFILAFVFMPSALTVLWKETHSRKRLFLYISAFVASMLFICARSPCRTPWISWQSPAMAAAWNRAA